MEVRHDPSIPLYRSQFFDMAAREVPAAAALIEAYGRVSLAEYSARRHEIDNAALNQVRKAVRQWFIETQGTTPAELVDAWVESVNPLFFNTGHGRRFTMTLARASGVVWEEWLVPSANVEAFLTSMPPFLVLAGLTNGDVWTLTAKDAWHP